jgi:hypothetical protein
MAQFKKYKVAYKGFAGVALVEQGVREEIVHSEEYAFARVKENVQRWNKRVDRIELVLISAE